METLTARGKQQQGEIQFPRNGERGIAHIPLSTRTQKGRETTKKTTGPQALELMSSQGLLALSTVLDHRGPCEIHQQDHVQPGGQLLHATS